MSGASTDLRVSGHAISRYRKRVAPVTYDQALAALSSERIRQAVAIGASSVILPSGHRAVLANGTVVTIIGRHRNKRNGGRNAV